MIEISEIRLKSENLRPCPVKKLCLAGQSVDTELL